MTDPTRKANSRPVAAVPLQPVVTAPVAVADAVEVAAPAVAPPARPPPATQFVTATAISPIQINPGANPVQTIAPFTVQGYPSVNAGGGPVVYFADLAKAARAATQAPASLLAFTRPYTEVSTAATTGNSRLNLPEIKARLGDYTEAGQLHVGKTFFEPRELMEGIARGGGMDAATAKLIAKAMPEMVTIVTPAHQYVVADATGKLRIGNRAIFSNGEEGGGDKDLVGLVHAAAKDGIFLPTAKTEWFAAQVGRVSDNIGSGNSGVGHQGTILAGYRDGKEVYVNVNWPFGYGKHLNEAAYSPTVQAVIPSMMTKTEPSAEDKKAWFSNYRNTMIFNIGSVDFTGSDPNPAYTSYSFNPLDADSPEKLAGLFKAQHSLSKESIVEAGYGTFYCAEGSNTSINMAVNGNSQHKKSLVPAGSPRATIMEMYEVAEKKIAAGLPAGEDVKKHANKVWDEMEKTLTSPTATAAQKAFHTNTFSNFIERVRGVGADALPLEWVPESTKGIEAYGLKNNRSGLAMDPDTVGNLLENVIANYFPLESIAKAVAAGMKDGFAKPGPHQAAMEKLIGEQTVNGSLDPARLEGFSRVAAANFVGGILGNPEMKDRLLKQAGFDSSLIDAGGKAKVEQAYGAFVQAVLSFGKVSYSETKDKIALANNLLSALDVERKIPNTNRTARGSMTYLDPGHISNSANGNGTQQGVVYVGTVRPIEMKQR